jgi:spoIIIJ-associated protein
MTAEMEFTGKTVQNAIQLAAKTLGLPVEDIDYEIVSHGSTGIFGLAGVKKARIKVRAQAGTERPAEPAIEAKAQDMPNAATTCDDADASCTKDARQVGEAVLRRMVDAISPESTISFEKHDHHPRFLVEGGQSGILIGKRGQTLEAIQLIVDKAVRRLNGHDIRFQVDVEGYLAKKKAGLVHAAGRLAQKVASKGNPSSIGYLSAQDRRVVHLALKNHHGVCTKSVGEGPVRKLMIYPKGHPRAKS